MLTPDGDIEQAFAGNGDDGRLVVGPFDSVSEEFGVIGREDFPEGTVEVEGEEDDARLPFLAGVTFRLRGLVLARVDLFHG